VNTPICPANTPKTLPDDPQFQDRLQWIPASQVGADQLPTPLRFLDMPLPVPEHAPTVGQHTDEVLRDVLDYDAARIDELRSTGAFGATNRPRT
jgi:crotonobetainyl-CoA:carnitine CoA-transferase CaiB-like acyl-CoA transferase